MAYMTWHSQVVGEVLRHVGAEDTPGVTLEALAAFESNSQKGSTMQASVP